MSVYLTKKEIEHYRPEIEEEFKTIIRHPWFSARENARQWQFFKRCFNVLTGEDTGDFECSEKQAIYYKYEVNDRLQRYYLAFGKPIKFIFHLINEKKAGISDYDEPDYPSCNNYKLRVSYNKHLPDAVQEKKLLIEKTIAEAMDAEFDAYQALPELEFARLAAIFDTNGSAYKEIVNRVKKHKKRKWIIRGDTNPSTKRLIDIRIGSLSETRAEVRTSEYWLLMWWSVEEKKYAHTYKEMNRQRYYLIWKDGRWLVQENIYGKPKTSTPRRNIRAPRGDQ
ncbi:MAG: hypothetical protein WKF34_06950 [Pyrinomonadaceae bacterium]